jgi:uncharacterized LabA/DUF88 family protein
VAIFIDGNNLFHAARSAGVEIDYAKLLNYLRGESPLLRAFFYTGVDERAERQQGFLLWMRRNGYRVVQKELKTFPDGTKKANLDVEIAVDMLSLAGHYDTAILVSGDEDFAYAINVIAYKGVRVEVVGFRSNTSPRLIDVADRFVDFDGIINEVCKAESRYAYNAPRQTRSASPGAPSQPLQPPPLAPPPPVASEIAPIPPVPVAQPPQPPPPPPTAAPEPATVGPIPVAQPPQPPPPAESFAAPPAPPAPPLERVADDEPASKSTTQVDG